MADSIQRANPLAKAVPIPKTERVRSRSGGDLLSPRSLDNTSLLLIDDMKFYHKMIKNFCNQLGWSFQGAYTDEEGFKAVTHKNFDVVICDFNLGDKQETGDIVAKKIRDLKPKQLIFSFSSSEVANEQYNGRPLWDGILGKLLTKKTLEIKIAPLLIQQKATWKR